MPLPSLIVYFKYVYSDCWFGSVAGLQRLSCIDRLVKLYLFKICGQIKSNNAATDQLTQNAVYYQGLYCLPPIKQFSANHKEIYQYFVLSFSFFLSFIIFVVFFFFSLDSALGTLGHSWKLCAAALKEEWNRR